VRGDTRAVYDSGYLAVYVEKGELDQLLDGLTVSVRLLAGQTEIGEGQVLVALMPLGMATLRKVVRAERRAYGRGRVRFKRWPGLPRI